MAERKNVIGEKYNKLTIIGDAQSTRQPSGKLVKRVNVKCDCGGTKESVAYKDLKKGTVKSCGCLIPPKNIINSGDRFGNITVLYEVFDYYECGRKKRAFMSKCVCGAEKIRDIGDLKSNIMKCHSCPSTAKPKEVKEKFIPQDTEEEQWKEPITFPTYYISTLGRVYSYKKQQVIGLDENSVTTPKGNRELRLEMWDLFVGEEVPKGFAIVFDGAKELKNLKLKETSTERVNKLRAIYSNMKVRCNNPSCKSYYLYGGKGIKIEESFDTFEKFFDWSINNGYEVNKGLEIDRINSDKNYSSDNCRWITKAENILNQKNVNLTIEDVNWIRSDKFTLEEALNKLKCSEHTIMNIRQYRTFKDV